MQLEVIIESKVGASEFCELGLLAERYGFGTIWIQNYSRAPDAFMTAVPLAMSSKRIGVGIAVICPYEMHPLKIANATLTLNEVSGGRARVVMGAGGEWPLVMGMQPAKIITGAKEGLEIIRGAFHDEVLNYDGELFSASGFSTDWTTQPPPLLYGGASGPQLLSTAAGIADGIMMSDVQPEMFDWGLPALKQALAESGRDTGDFQIDNFLAWHVKEDREASLREARRELIIRGWLERPWLAKYLGEQDAAMVVANRWPFLKAYRDRSGDIEGVEPRIVDTLVDRLSCAGDLGDLDRHIERLQAFAAAGFTAIAFGLQDDPAVSIQMIGERVMPRLQ